MNPQVNLSEGNLQGAEARRRAREAYIASFSKGYLLAVSVMPMVQSERAAIRSLQAIRSLSPAPEKILVIDYSHLLSRDLSSDQLSRHELKTPKDAPRAQLHELADEVWAENMNTRPDGGFESDYDQYSPRSFAIERCLALKLSSMLFMHFGDRFEPQLSKICLERLGPGRPLVLVNAIKCDWHAEPDDPPQFSYSKLIQDQLQLNVGFMVRVVGLSTDYMRNQELAKSMNDPSRVALDVMTSGVSVLLEGPMYYAVGKSVPYPFDLADPIVDPNSSIGVKYNEELRQPLIEKLQAESAAVMEMNSNG